METQITNQKLSQPLKTNCFHCHKAFTIKYVRATHQYSQKNNWGYWTEIAEQETKYLCDDCLVKLYRQHKWEFRRLIPNKKKQTLFRQYLANGAIRGQAEAVFITNQESNLGCCSHCSKKKKKKTG